MGMTLEEAIKHYMKIAEENEKDAEQFKRIKATQDIISHCYECAKDHRQLAEWLSELNAYRKAEKEIEQTMDLDDRDDIDDGKCRGLFLATCIIQHYKNEEVTADDK